MISANTCLASTLSADDVPAKSTFRGHSFGGTAFGETFVCVFTLSAAVQSQRRAAKQFSNPSVAARLVLLLALLPTTTACTVVDSDWALPDSELEI